MNDLSCFDEVVLWDRQLKCVPIFGLCLGFRGDEEHYDFKVHNVHTGKFEAGRPYDFCEGCIGVKNSCDKTTKISLKNGHAQLENNKLRLPILSLTDPNDPGRMLCRCIEKKSPDQQRMCFEEASVVQNYDVIC